VDRAISILKKEGKIAFIGPKKKGHWEILK
jgi:predicted HTH transcriptional regulator